MKMLPMVALLFLLEQLFASLIDLDATATGSAVFIDNGVYFVRGFFADVSKRNFNIRLLYKYSII